MVDKVGDRCQRRRLPEVPSVTSHQPSMTATARRRNFILLSERGKNRTVVDLSSESFQLLTQERLPSVKSLKVRNLFSLTP